MTPVEALLAMMLAAATIVAGFVTASNIERIEALERMSSGIWTELLALKHLARPLPRRIDRNHLENDDE